MHNYLVARRKPLQHREETEHSKITEEWEATAQHRGDHTTQWKVTDVCIGRVTERILRTRNCRKTFIVLKNPSYYNLREKPGPQNKQQKTNLEGWHPQSLLNKEEILTCTLVEVVIMFLFLLTACFSVYLFYCVLSYCWLHFHLI
jgi:hypothetical protein